MKVNKILLAAVCTLAVVAHVTMTALGAGDLVAHYWLAPDAPGDHVHAIVDIAIMLSVATLFSGVALTGWIIERGR